MAAGENSAFFSVDSRINGTRAVLNEMLDRFSVIGQHSADSVEILDEMARCRYNMR
jgi:hypothetical protein